MVLINMNKSDLRLILIIGFLSVLFIVGVNLFSKKGSVALVYHDGILVRTIDLKYDSSNVVNGNNGEVHIKVSNGRIKVEEENSPLHLCSKQGYVDSSHESIVCLPNKIVINIKDDSSEYDAVVK